MLSENLKKAIHAHELENEYRERNITAKINYRECVKHNQYCLSLLSAEEKAELDQILEYCRENNLKPHCGE
jgi:N12 class adenine-specific DNA methylase